MDNVGSNGLESETDCSNTCASCLHGTEVTDSLEYYDEILWNCSAPIPKCRTDYRQPLRADESHGCLCWKGRPMMAYSTPKEGPTISVPHDLWHAVGEEEMNGRMRKALKILEGCDGKGTK